MHMYMYVPKSSRTFQLCVSNTIALAEVAIYNIQYVTSCHTLQPQYIQVLLKRFNWATANSNSMNSRLIRD